MKSIGVQTQTDPKPGRQRRSEGFTLVETVLVVSMVGLISGVLALAVTAVARNEGSISTRITETRDLQNMTNYLPRDVASARVISTSSSPPNACGAVGTPVLHFEWDEEWRGSLFTARVTYREVVDGAATTLVRFECFNSDPATSVVLAAVYQSAVFSCPVKATVAAEFVYPEGERTITATSRNFPEQGACAT